jgi:hypothetical protein
MNELLKQMLRLGGYMNEADDGTGGGASGGAAADRGDDLAPADIGDKADDKGADGADEKKEGEGDGEAAGADGDNKDGEDKDDETPRDKDGKFTKKDPVIPKARFDELNRKAREREAALQTRIAELEKQAVKEVQQQDSAKLEKEIEDLEEEYQKLLDDGKTDKAKEVMRQIRLKERQVVAMEVEHKSEKARVQAVEQLKFDNLVEKLESEYPVLNPDADEFDEAKVEEVVFLRQSFERSGMSSTAALAKAVKYVLGDVQKKDEPAPKRGIDADGKKDARRAEQVKKNIDAAVKQPAKMGDAGMDSNKKGGGLDTSNVNDMSEEEFNALPAATKARLRGDTFDEVAA